MPRSVKHGGKKVYKFRSVKNAAKSKNKAEKRKKRLKTQCVQLKEAWDHDKTVRMNLEAMGLVYDPNVAIPLRKPEKVIEEPEAGSMEVEEVDISEIGKINAIQKKTLKKKQRKVKKPTELEVKATKVVENLEKAAKEEEEKQKEGREYKLQARDIEFCVYMDTKHKDDFKAMSRDPRNIWQETPKQLERKMRIYKKSSYYEALESMETAETA